ncbi:hypothetical protein CIPAW_14G130900 [Carya illinoinensis]|uniref:TIR domain-containing protein n=1 Tax=Carya illinoinensis TaxID=32201 RepID=A0A8T1NE56_CARIL|nr:hypothetical protein CIPAW_14G130900 [Carya illinoinensis]
MGQIIATLRPSSSTNSENTKKRKRDDSSCSEEDERIISSSLPSSSTARWKHDVFLSFCGEDTRRSFTDHLYSYLKGKGILVFRDDESLERGTYISQELMQAIQESRYAIVIFSENYAFSKWCLRELAEIVEWEEKKNLTIIPIFYHVDPSDVRKQRGTFAKAFAAHENHLRVDIEEINTWRNACTKVGYIKGEHINGDRYESTIIQQISEMILYNYTMPNILIHENQKIVGIDSRVGEILNLLHMESNDVRFLGIHGMGGVGKTTLAEIIYCRFSCRFEGSSFISCTGQRSTTARDLASLQKELLSAIMKEKIRVYNQYQGNGTIMEMLQNKKVLIILDDVDCEKLLSALAGDRKWFGRGSRVIITCRDSHLLTTHKVNCKYEVQPLETPYALQLFSLSAFNKNHPPDNYKYLSMDFVKYSGGLPLALKVLGSFLVERTLDSWKSIKDKLEAIPNTEIFDILKISFDWLEESQKKLFLDLACLYLIWPFNLYDLKEIYPAIDFEVLADKSLLSKSDYDKGYLKMHDLLKKMGQEIVRLEDPVKPGRRSRLCCKEDVLHVLEKDTGTEAIEVICLYDLAGQAKPFNIKAKAFSEMKNLRFLYFCLSPSYINWPGYPLECMPSAYIKWDGNPLQYVPSDKLQLLDWESCPSTSWPDGFRPKGLIKLRMHHSRFERLWEGLMVLDNLKYLGLSGCDELIETPNLSQAPNLEEIDFSDCKNLCNVDPSIRFLRQLKHLRLNGCPRLEYFPTTLGDMISLENLSLPSSEVSIFPNVIYSFSSLESLWLDGWPRLEKLPELSKLECLKEFKAYETSISQIPSINLIPKSIRCFELEGGKRMPRESRDLVMFNNDCSLPKQSSYPTNHDIGSPVEYETEEKFSVQIHCDYDVSLSISLSSSI